MRDVCERSLSLLSKYSLEWGNRVRTEQFRFHNAQWLEMIEREDADLSWGEEEGEEDMDRVSFDREYYGESAEEGDGEEKIF